MIQTQAHDNQSVDKEWIQCGNSHATIAIVRGDVVVWDLAALPATSSGKRVYVNQSAATANLVTVAGVAEEAIPAADFTFMANVLRYGYFSSLKFTGTASVTRIQTGAAVGAAKALVPTAVADVAGSFGLCITPSGTPATVEAIIDVHL